MTLFWKFCLLGGAPLRVRRFLLSCVADVDFVWHPFCYHVAIMHEQLSQYLEAQARDACFRVDEVLKETPFETTERVFFQGANGSELGPFIRKRIDCESGMGVVYETLFEGQSAGKRFLHLPRVYACHHVDDALVVLMEYLEGETLADVVRRHTPSIELAREVFPQLCDAAIELHAGFDVPLIHRDLKPSNAMLVGGTLTVIDFGIARSYKDGAMEDTRHFGTRAYAPPEQFGFGQTDVRSDVYALGLLLYFCLTGETPDFAAREAGYASPCVPETLRLVVARAAAFDPGVRYGSAEELKQAFLAAIEVEVGVGAAMGNGGVVGCVMTDEGALGPSFSCDSDSAPAVATASGIVFGRLLSRIPFALGVIWDVLLVAAFLLLCLGAVGVTVDPKPTSTSYAFPVIQRGFVATSIVLLVAAPILFLVADRRPILRVFPRFAKVSLWREAVVCFALFCLGCTLVGIFG